MESNGNRIVELLAEISKKLDVLEDVRSEQQKMREEQKLILEELIKTNQRLDWVDGSLKHLITVTEGLQKTDREGFECFGDRLLAGMKEIVL